MDILRLEAQIVYRNAQQNIMYPFKPRNVFLLYGMPKTGKGRQIVKCFPSQMFHRHLIDCVDIQLNKGMPNVTASPKSDDDDDDISKKPHVYVIRHLELLLRGDAPYGIQDCMKGFIEKIGGFDNTVVIATLSGYPPTSFDRDLLSTFNFQFYVPLPTPEERIQEAKAVFETFVMNQENARLDLTDEDWELFSDSSRYADYGVIEKYLYAVVNVVNRAYVANDCLGERVINGQVMRQCMHMVENDPCIVGYNLDSRSMMVRQYAKTQDEEKKLVEAVTDPTSVKKRKNKKQNTAHNKKRKKRKKH